MSTPPPNPLRNHAPGRKPSGSMKAVIKAEKLTQIAFALPASVLVGWLGGVALDKLLHQHWIYIAGLVLGAIAGFVQIFRMITDPQLLAASAYDPTAAKGPGFDDKDAAGKDGPR